MNRLVLALAVAPLALTLHSAPAGASDRAAAPRQVFDVSDLDTGAAPQVAWAERTRASRVVIHGPDGATPAPGNVRAFAPMGSGYVVQTGGARPPRVRWIGADGTPGPREWRTGYGLAVSSGGEAVAFTGRRGQVRVIDSEGDRVLRMPRVPGRGLHTPAVVFGEDCQESETSNGCAIMVNSTRRPLSWVTSSHGIVDRTPFQTVTTGRGRWLGGIVSRTDTGTCNAMRRGTRTRWTTCRNQLSTISPDRRHLVGTPAYADGFGPTRLDFLDLRSGDRTRSLVSDRQGRSATYVDQVWEDSEHLLVVTFQAGEWAIVRLGTDGSMEYAVPPRPDGGDLDAPLYLTTG
ncbi:hypothetical protein [Nocardioides sp. P5_C9_2]